MPRSFSTTPVHIRLLLCIVLWSGCHVCNLTALKLIGPDVPITIMLLVRTLFGIAVLILPTLLTTRRLPSIRTRAPKLQAVRALLILASMSATYYGYRVFPISLGTALGFMQPFFVSIFALLFLKEKIPMMQWAVLGVGYAGALFFSNPFEHGDPLGAGILLIANVFASLAVILTKKLSSYDSPRTILFFSFTTIAIVMGILSIFTWQPVTLLDIVLLLIMGIFGTLSQYTFIIAMDLSSASFIAPFDYFKLVVAIPMGVMLFDEHVTWHIALGGALIVAANWYLIRHQPKSG